MEFATFAGGCFWCTQALFKRLKGVTSVTSGYAGKAEGSPTYQEISTGKTGFVEAVQVEFNPEVISFNHLLDIFWATHDSTTLNRQGPDVGTQYRSVIFYHSNNQKKEALESKEKLEKSGQLDNKVVTEIIPFNKFYKAEDYHQNYYERAKDLSPYCSLVIAPKIKKLLDQFNKDVKEQYL